MPLERLLVVEPFGDHAFGDRIEGEAAIRKTLKSHPQHVVREVVEDEASPATPAPEPPPADQASHMRRTRHALNG